MKSKPKNQAWLLDTAKDVAERLRLHTEGTRLRIRSPRAVSEMETDGWRAIIGDLGTNQPRLEVWFDRFSGYPQRKLYAGFHSKVEQQITSITKRVAQKLWPTRIVNTGDTETSEFLVLAKRLTRAEFNVPVLEKYESGRNYYGIFDPTRETAERISPYFCARAAAFFEDVARSLPNAKPEDKQREVYPRIENRRIVALHLSRERSKYLAFECKNRDKFECQVCGLRFEDAYGSLGSEYAEAHHIIPLSQLKEHVRTRLEDLITVCANCHRMLHRMEGKRDDLKKLKAIVRNHRQ